jgi:hypothetical protein
MPSPLVTSLVTSLVILLVTLPACAPQMWMPLSEGDAHWNAEPGTDTGWVFGAEVMGAWEREYDKDDTHRRQLLEFLSDKTFEWRLYVDDRLDSTAEGTWNWIDDGVQITDDKCQWVGQYAPDATADTLDLLAVYDNCENRRAILDAAWTAQES